MSEGELKKRIRERIMWSNTIIQTPDGDKTEIEIITEILDEAAKEIKQRIAIYGYTPTSHPALFRILDEWFGEGEQK